MIYAQRFYTFLCKRAIHVGVLIHVQQVLYENTEPSHCLLRHFLYSKSCMKILSSTTNPKPSHCLLGQIQFQPRQSHLGA